MKAQSPEKFVDVCDVNVTDEDGFLSCSKTIKANNKDRERTNLDKSGHQQDHETAFVYRH